MTNWRYDMTSPGNYIPPTSNTTTTLNRPDSNQAPPPPPENKLFIIWIILGVCVVLYIVLSWCDRRRNARVSSTATVSTDPTTTPSDDKDKQILLNPDVRRTIYSQVFEILGNQCQLSKKHFRPIETLDLENGKCTIEPHHAKDVDETESETSETCVLAFPKDPEKDDDLCCTSVICAICLEQYQDGTTIVWSQDTDCPHVYHKECFVDYLSQRKKPSFEENPCPTCRRNFCKIDVV